MTEVQDRWARTIPLGGMLGLGHNGRQHLFDRDRVWPSIGTDWVARQENKVGLIGNRTLDNALGEFTVEH
nr:hypothetical protein CFP56_12821 [Quercus suber]